MCRVPSLQEVTQVQYPRAVGADSGLSRRCIRRLAGEPYQVRASEHRGRQPRDPAPGRPLATSRCGVLRLLALSCLSVLFVLCCLYVLCV